MQVSKEPAYQTVTKIEWHIPDTCLPDGHQHRVTYTRCRIDTIDSPDDKNKGARNMKENEINIYGKELCIKLVIYKNFYVRLYTLLLQGTFSDS
jgi:hypothetical protein